jgi:sugar/nucleoside kinase (ribokinase family)
LHEASVHCSLDGENCQLCMSFADKIPYESLTVVPGVGNSANVAVAAARLGFNVGFLSAVGADRNGEDMLSVYHREGVSTEFIKINKTKPTNYHFVLNFKAERTILIKHQDYDYMDPLRVLDGKTSWIYFSSIGEHSLPLHHKLGEYLKKHPDVKMGFNPGTFQFKLGTKKLKTIYEKTHVLFVNREEAARIANTKSLDIPFLFKAMHKLGPKIVCITDGPKGAYASDGTLSYFMPPYPDPKPPISRTGAGDAFASGFLCALMFGLPIQDALRWAPIESMHVVQFFGAQTGLLTKSKLMGFLKKAPKHYKPKAL